MTFQFLWMRRERKCFFNPSSSDLFTNTDGLMAVAKIFYKAGVSWTLSSRIEETANFGLFFHEPTLRELLRACVERFVEMTPTEQYSYCCGGGSGIIMDEAMELRMNLGKPKAESVKRTNADILCAPCAICKARLPVVMNYYKVNVKVKGLSDLMGRALIL